MNRGKITTVFFDVGSTLLYANPSVEETFVEVAAAQGFRLALDEVIPCMPNMWGLYEDLYRQDASFWCSEEGTHWLWDTLYSRLCDLTGLGAAKDKLVGPMKEAYQHGHHWSLYDDVLPCLEVLSESGLRLAVVSNWAPNLPTLLQELGVGGYFEHVFASGATGMKKPDSEFFLHACSQLGVDPSEVVHVGDHPDADGRGATAAGLGAVILNRDNATVPVGMRSISSLSVLPCILDFAENEVK